MASLTSKTLIRVAGEHAALAAYIGGLTVALAVLVRVVPARPRVCAAVIDDAAVADRLSRSSLLGVAGAAGSGVCRGTLAWSVSGAPVGTAAVGVAGLWEKACAAGTAGALAGRWA